VKNLARIWRVALDSTHWPLVEERFKRSSKEGFIFAFLFASSSAFFLAASSLASLSASYFFLKASLSAFLIAFSSGLITTFFILSKLAFIGLL